MLGELAAAGVFSFFLRTIMQWRQSSVSTLTQAVSRAGMRVLVLSIVLAQ
jgi:hypothetical protein